MKKFMKKKYWLTFGIFLLVMFSIPKTKLLAAPAETGSITFSYKLSGVEFKLYEVGQIDASGKVVYEDAFKEYKVNLDDPYAAQTLKHFVDRDKIPHIAAATTDDTLSVKFENLKAEKNIYLICGAEKIEGELKYIPTPALVTLPTESGGIKYKDINVINKCETEEVEPIDLSIVIIWEDEGVEEERPEEIIVQLIKDGEVVDEVVLGPDNNWSYEWEDLDPDHEWTIVEKIIPPEYGFSIRKEGDLYIIVHDRGPETELPENESTTNTPTTGTPSTNTTVPGESTTVLPPETNSAQLPQTGQLWWPVYSLVFIGLFCLVVGLIFKRTERE